VDLLGLAGTLHEWLDLAVAAGAAGVVALSIAMLLGVERARFAIDWLILGLVGVTLAGAVAGIVLLAGMGGPRDVLHYVYAVLVLAAVPIARVAGGRASPSDAPPPGARWSLRSLRHRHLAAWLIGGSLTTLAALLRLAATG
jgi:hypothetical protein